MAVATDKTRVSTYIDQRLKELAEKVAASQGRSLSNYIEQLIKQDVIRAQKEGEIND
jgi:predicted HicB family RNase H-like nuclease